MDLNLVRVFVAVYEARSLTVAADRLFVTQPAVSQALRRLRREFDDPLFERSGRIVVPTPLAEATYPGFRDALARIDRTMDEMRGFVPEDTERLFRIALSELGEIGWLSVITRAVRAGAPHARMDIVPLDNATVGEHLARGVIDLAITSAALPGLEHRRVKREHYRVALGAKHPLANASLTLDAYRRAQRIAVTGDSGAQNLEAAHRHVGGVRAPALMVQHFGSLPELLSSGEFLATIPETLADGWASTWPIRAHEVPFALPDAELHLYRRNTTQQLSALDWIYATVGDVVSRTPGSFTVIQAPR